MRWPPKLHGSIPSYQDNGSTRPRQDLRQGSRIVSMPIRAATHVLIAALVCQNRPMLPQVDLMAQDATEFNDLTSERAGFEAASSPPLKHLLTT